MPTKCSKIKTAIILITLFSVLSICSISLVSAQNNVGDLSVSVTTDKNEYASGENVYVSGYVYNTTTFEPASANVLIQVFKGNNTIFSVNEATFNGTYGNGDFRVLDKGTLTISATAILSGATATASTTVTAKPYGEYYSFFAQVIPIAIAIGSFSYFVILLFTTHKEKGRILEGHKFVAAEFIFLTLFTISLVLFLLFNDTPIGVNSQMGLVVNTYGNETQWVINIGGQKLADSAQYVGGIQVPIYVIVLSFLGAYVYFLTKVPSLVKLEQEELEDEGLKYLVRFFIAPLLAIALYLVMWQLEVRGTFILGAISFATGLIIEEVTDRILQFAKDTIGKKEGSTEAPNANENKTPKKDKNNEQNAATERGGDTAEETTTGSDVL